MKKNYNTWFTLAMVYDIFLWQHDAETTTEKEQNECGKGNL